MTGLEFILTYPMEVLILRHIQHIAVVILDLNTLSGTKPKTLTPNKLKVRLSSPSLLYGSTPPPGIRLTSKDIRKPLHSKQPTHKIDHFIPGGGGGGELPCERGGDARLKV